MTKPAPVPPSQRSSTPVAAAPPPAADPSPGSEGLVPRTHDPHAPEGDPVHASACLAGPVGAGIAVAPGNPPPASTAAQAAARPGWGGSAPAGGTDEPAAASVPSAAARPMAGFGWHRLALWAWQGLGGALAVGGMEVAAHLGETPLALIPFATSIVLVLGLPDSDAAQPRALVGGHVISTAVGLLMLALFGRSEPAAAAAVGLAMVAMRTTRTMHPPAAINPIIVVMEAMQPGFLLAPVLVGALLLAGYAWAWHNLARPRSWPARWW